MAGSGNLPNPSNANFPPCWEIWSAEVFEQTMGLKMAFGISPLKEDQEPPSVSKAEGMAEGYLRDGNTCFMLKMYYKAIKYYGKGIAVKCKHDLINAHLYANRSTAHIHLGNFRQALRDAVESKRFKPDHLRAFQRGATCCDELQEWSDCISWCNEGLTVAPGDAPLTTLKKRAEEKIKVAEAKRKEELLLAAARRLDSMRKKMMTQTSGSDPPASPDPSYSL